ncbi:globin domain-containing protein [Actinoplanes sp. NPDC049596]|uniref:globin domain-containing protein n=1 Tax=unclassified Actinoplanes TaxID=2626549 RepID=UPI00341FD875
MLSQKSAPIVAATLPVVGAHIDQISGVFYDTMLGENPDLLNLFSRSAQATGEQKSALAGAVALFATHLSGEAPLPEHVVTRIAQRHCALGIRPEQYAMVGKYLLGAVGTVLGDAVTPEIAAAWDEVYWLFAVRLIGLESRIYAEAGVDGENPWRTYVVANKVAEADDTVSLILTPSDGEPVPHYRPGQYVTIAATRPDGTRQLRQYSLSQAPNGGTLRITVRRVRGVNGTPDGVVSGWIHDTVRPGDALTVSQAYGDLTLPAQGDHPLLLISAGVGITPMAAILDEVSRTQPGRPVTVVHADRSPSRHPLRAEVAAAGARLREFDHLAWYDTPVAGAFTGRIDPDRIPLRPGAEVYLCGPVPFMQAVRAALHRRGLSEDRIRYEVFGSEQWRTVPVPA